MCGRYNLHSRLNLLLQQFALDAGPDWAPQLNIAPTQQALIVRQRDEGTRELVPLRWGLVPSWAKESSIGQRMINARAETVSSKPSFRSAFKRRRCLVPADGYYEWMKTEEGKQPYCIRPRDEGPFAMAGLWETWHSGREDGLETFTIITTDAAESVASIHDRMPVILHPDDYPLWLDPEFDAAAPLEALLRPFESDQLTYEPVSKRLNNPRFQPQSMDELKI